MQTWIFNAILSAVFAALVTILSKVGLHGVNSNLATAIRTVVILPLAWAVVFATGEHKGIAHIDAKGVVFLVLSGLATGASWLFYFRALREGPAGSVAVIDKSSVLLTIILAVLVLGEPFSYKALVAAVLIAAGCIVMTL